MKPTLARAALIAAALVAAPRAVSAQWWFDDVLRSSDPHKNAFGSAVDTFGDTLAVGAHFDDTAALNAGAVYVFVRSGSDWVEQAKLYGSDVTIYDRVGEQVALSGDTLIAGANANGQAPNLGGEAYVWVRSGTTWSEQARLVGSLVTSGDWFGSAVDVEGDTALVGARSEVAGAVQRAGAVYVFTRTGSTWSEESLFHANDPESYSEFGNDLALDASTAVVACPEDDTLGGLQGGSIYVFVRSGTTWTQQAKLLSIGQAAFDQFGSAVDIDGDTIVAGAQFADPGGKSSAGAAYVFVRSGTTWTQQAKLVASNGKPDERFGQSAAIEGDTIVIGAAADAAGQNFSGKAYVFTRSGTVWTEVLRLREPTPGAYNGFGNDVALRSGRMVVGCPYADFPAEPDVGGAYAYEDAASFETYCTAGTSAAGCAASIAASGTPSAVASSGFSLTATGVEGAKNGNFLYATTPRQAVPWGNGSSWRCFGAPLQRGAFQAGAGTPGLCDGTFAEDLNARWCSTCPRPAHNPGPGATMRGQLWYRDPLNTSNRTSSFSDAVEWTLSL